MFCKNCGKKMEEGQVFCAACGTRASIVQEGQTQSLQGTQVGPQGQMQQPQATQNQPQVQPQFNQVQPQGQPQFNQNQPQPTQGQPVGQNFGQPAQVNQGYYNNGSMMNNNINQPRSNNGQNTQRSILAIGVIALIVLGIYFGPKLFKGGLFGGSSSSPEAVVKAFFNSVYKEDPDAMLKLIHKDDMEENKDELDKDYLKSMLEEVNAAMKDQYGDDWIKKVEYKTATETDSSSDYKQYKVKVIMDGEADYIYVKKIGTKYYLDPNSL